LLSNEWPIHERLVGYRPYYCDSSDVFDCLLLYNETHTVIDLWQWW